MRSVEKWIDPSTLRNIVGNANTPAVTGRISANRLRCSAGNCERRKLVRIVFLANTLNFFQAGWTSNATFRYRGRYLGFFIFGILR